MIELYGNLGVRTTDAASPSAARTTVNAVSWSNHLQVGSMSDPEHVGSEASPSPRTSQQVTDESRAAVREDVRVPDEIEDNLRASDDVALIFWSSGETPPRGSGGEATKRRLGSQEPRCTWSV